MKSYDDRKGGEYSSGGRRNTGKRTRSSVPSTGKTTSSPRGRRRSGGGGGSQGNKVSASPSSKPTPKVPGAAKSISVGSMKPRGPFGRENGSWPPKRMKPGKLGKGFPGKTPRDTEKTTNTKGGGAPRGYF